MAKVEQRAKRIAAEYGREAADVATGDDPGEWPEQGLIDVEGCWHSAGGRSDMPNRVDRELSAIFRDSYAARYAERFGK